MKQLKDNMEEVTYEDFVKQIDDFKNNYVPKMLQDFEDKGYYVDTCAYVLSATVGALLRVADDGLLKKECIKSIEEETKDIKEMESRMPDIEEAIKNQKL
jgi:hypothetical protein